MKSAFIAKHLRDQPVDIVCEVLEVSRSGYYAWLRRPQSKQSRRRMALSIKIVQVHADNRGVYGSPRVFAALRSQGQSVSLNTVARIMRDQGLWAKVKRKFVLRTTDSTHRQPIAPNVLDRQFDAPCPNRKWAGDIAYIPMDEGWLYLAGVIDLHSRRIVGWSMADHMQTDLVADALSMALARRRPGRGLLHHRDRGVQYASDNYQGLLKSSGI